MDDRIKIIYMVMMDSGYSSLVKLLGPHNSSEEMVDTLRSAMEIIRSYTNKDDIL